MTVTPKQAFNASPAVFDSALPNALYTSAQVRELDQLAINKVGIAAATLMSRAGHAAFAALRKRWPEVNSITVVCGGGNNAGDGYVVAALAAQKRIAVRVLWLKPPAELVGPAQQAYQYASQEGVLMMPFDQADLGDQAFAAGVFVDALLGTGTSGKVREPFSTAIDWLNRLAGPVLALDIPSGLCANTGAELGIAVRADLTVTFLACKQGLLTGRGPAVAGQLVFASLDVPEHILTALAPSSEICQLSHLLKALPARPADAHKGQFGHILVIGGDKGMGGAAVMAAEMAARSGVGLVSVATQPEHLLPVLARIPEAMAMGVASGQELEPHLVRPNVLAIGPGLGRSPWSEQMLQQAAKSNLPMVVDADALNLLAAGRVLPAARRDNWILTPHPGEAGRLLGKTTAEIQADRFSAARALQARYGGVVVLKGAGTLIADGEWTWLAAVGNAGMAVGGMGDILSGIIGGLLAQGIAPSVAAQLGVCVHGTAGDMVASEKGQRGMLPTDLIPYVRELLNS